MPISLGERLKAARKAAGMTQRQLADKIKVSNTSISNWENGFSNPDPDTIQHLCWALNVQPNYFFAIDTSAESKNDDKNVIQTIGRDGKVRVKILSDKEYEALHSFLDLLEDVPDGT